MPGQRLLLPGQGVCLGSWLEQGTRDGYRAAVPWRSREVGSPSTVCPGWGGLGGASGAPAPRREAALLSRARSSPEMEPVKMSRVKHM